MALTQDDEPALTSEERLGLDLEIAVDRLSRVFGGSVAVIRNRHLGFRSGNHTVLAPCEYAPFSSGFSHAACQSPRLWIVIGLQGTGVAVDTLDEACAALALVLARDT